MWRLTEFADNTAIIDEQGKQFSYTELEAESKKLVDSFQAKRCLVFVLCENQLGSLLGYVGFINHKIVPLMLDVHLNRDLLQNLMDSYKPEYLWVPQANAHEFAAMTPIYQAHEYVLLKTAFTQGFELYPELALLLTTSGSTGSPKLVRLSYANLLSNTQAIVTYLNLSSQERPITTLPMSYTYGLSIINSHLYVGASIILSNHKMIQPEFWALLKSQKATSFGGVPYTYEMLDKLRFQRMTLPDLKTLTQAGGRLSRELHQKFADYALSTGKKFVVMYGQTEATARISYLPPDMSINKIGSIGIAIPGGKLNLIDDQGTLIQGPHVSGELFYEGTNVTLGYAESGRDLSKGDERNGVLSTGDLAMRDEDGYFYIVGRKKRFLKLYGSRVNLDEVEQLLKSRYPELSIACSGVDDKLTIFVAGDSDDHDILKFITEKTTTNPLAFKVKHIEKIPLNEAGKTLYSALESHYD